MGYQKHGIAVGMFARLMRFSARVMALPGKLTPPPFRLLQIGAAYWQSRALHAAASLDIATAIGEEDLEAREIAARVASDPDATFRLLRMLASVGVFEQTAPRRFRNNKVSAYLREDNPRNLRAMVLMHNSPTISRPWCEALEPGIREGALPFQLVHGSGLFDYMDAHADFDSLFAKAMDGVEALVGDSYASDFDWSRFQRLIDVGGSKGSKSVAILKHHPGLQAWVIDRAPVVQEAPGWWRGRADASLLGRMRFQVGDVLGELPAAESDGDVYLLSALLHGFDDETSVRALRNLADAIGGSGARVAVMEMILPEMHADPAGSAFDMQMLVTAGGRERTLAEWRDLFERAGLQLEEMVGLRSLGAIMVLRRAPG
jgi:hypothetical protein